MLRIVLSVVVSAAVVAVTMQLFIVPGSPWENGYMESFNGKLRRVP